MNIISIKQFREHFQQVKTGLKQGKKYLLLYRSQPLAHLSPFLPDEETAERSLSTLERDHAVRKVQKISGGLKLGKGRTPKEMNRDYHASYEEMLS